MRFKVWILGLTHWVFEASFPEYVTGQTPHVFFRPFDRMFPLKPGDELFNDAPDAKVDEGMQFEFELEFGEAGIIEGAPLIQTLHKMVQVVDNIVTDFGPLL